MSARLKVHPAAELIPVMTQGELAELTKDVGDNGQKEPIDLLDGKILDGRHRYEACMRLGITPKTRAWSGSDPIDYVISKNLHRRHLNESQRAMIIVKAGLMRDLETKALERKKAAGGDKRLAPRGAKRSPEPERKPTMNGKAAKAAGVVVGVGTRSIERSKMIMAKRPELEPKISAGEMTVKQAEKQIRKEEAIKKVVEYRPPQGEFSVIVADPPWPYEDELNGSDGARGGLPYPPMTVDDILTMNVPAAADCILWLWTTNAHLVDGTAAAVVKAWGFEAKTLLTWNKTQMGAGRWLRGKTEHCILAVRGKPIVTLTNQTTEITAPRGAHSEKPAAFYALVDSLCPAPTKLELFARVAERAGWTVSGAERPSAAAEKRRPRSNCRIEDAEANA